MSWLFLYLFHLLGKWILLCAKTLLQCWFLGVFLRLTSNYARWLPSHVRDMLALDIIAPRIWEGSLCCSKNTQCLLFYSHWSCSWTKQQASKRCRWSYWSYRRPPQLLRWIVCGQEMTRVVKEFELSQELIRYEQSKGPDIRHH